MPPRVACFTKKTAPPPAPSPARRSDLDWLRVGALGLLILTHVTFIFRTTGWRVHSEHESIYNAIRNQDAESARAAMRTHLSNSRDRLRKPRNPGE
jgi:DNA-binding GntR family transcriptional regulator